MPAAAVLQMPQGEVSDTTLALAAHADENTAADLLVEYLELAIGAPLPPMHQGQVRSIVRSIVEAATNQTIVAMRAELDRRYHIPRRPPV